MVEGLGGESSDGSRRMTSVRRENEEDKWASIAADCYGEWVGEPSVFKFFHVAFSIGW